MKKLIFLAILVGAGYYVWHNVLFKEDSLAVKTYKQFANAYVVRDYENAQLYAAGDVATHLEEQMSKRTMKFMGMQIDTPLSGKGILEGVNYKIKSEETVGNEVEIVAAMHASISWGGSTANPNAPGSYVGRNQTATVRDTDTGWKVVEFTDKLKPKAN